jgi:PST family polysaccharide transporter
MKRLLANQSALGIQYAANSLLPLLLVPHVVRNIGLESFGALSIALAFGAYGALVINYGFTLTGPPKVLQAPSPADRAAVVRGILSAKALLTGAVLGAFALGLAIGASLGYRIGAAEIVMLAALPLAAGLNMAWYLQALERFGPIALSAVIAVAVALGIGFFFVRGDDAAAQLAAAFALTAGSVLTGLLTAVVGTRIFRRSGGALAWHPPAAELREGFPFFVSQLVAALYGASGVLIVGLLAGAAEAGVYSVGERLANAVGGACLLVHTAAYPRLSSLYHAARERYFRLLLQVAAVYWSCVLVVLVTAVTFWDVLQQYFFGAVSARHASVLATSLCLVAAMLFGMMYTGYLTVSGRSRLVLPLTLKLLGLSILVGVPATSAFGAAGWLATLALSHLVVGVVAWRAWRRERSVSGSAAPETAQGLQASE